MRRISAILVCCFSLGAVQARADECTTPPTPVRDISAERFYTDAQFSVPDVSAVARNKASLVELDGQLRKVINDSNAWMAKRDQSRAECGLQWLKAFAEGGMMLGSMNSMQAEYERKWRTAGIAVAYLKLKPKASPVQKAAIEPWLNALASKVEASETKVRTRNNHHYWVGLAATAVGFATGDKGHIAYGRRAFDHGMSAITEQGTLPLEMARGTMALHYHNYALAPLVLSAEIAAHGGQNWYEAASPIHRLAAFTMTSIKDATHVEELAGIAQKIPQGSILGWVAFYGRRFPDKVVGLNPNRMYDYSWFGGDLTTMAKAWVKS